VIDTLRFVNAQDGFAFEREVPTSSTAATALTAPSPSASSTPLWLTDDGGAHWHATGLRGVLAFAHNDRFAFVLTGRCHLGTCSDLGLHRLMEATGRWRLLTSPFVSVAPTVGMTASGSSLWISGRPAGRATVQPHLFATSNGGRHFVPKASPCAGRADIVAASATALWAVCEGATPTIARGTDAGDRWAKVVVPARLGYDAAIAPSGATSAVLATGTSNELLRTSDGGKTFRAVTPHGADGRWSVLRFTPSGNGGGLLVTPVATVQVWRSTNGGADWTGPLRIGS
jgi:hypothetical protein